MLRQIFPSRNKLRHCGLSWYKFWHCGVSQHSISRSHNMLQHILYQKRCVSTKELEQRRLELSANDPLLADTKAVWKDIFLPHISNVVDGLANKKPGPSRTAPTLGAMALQFATTGAVKLPGLYLPSDIGSVLLELSKMDDPYRLFWHKDEVDFSKKRRSHLGIQTHIKAPATTWDTAPFLDLLAPGSS